jgi:galactonate dehydratase
MKIKDIQTLVVNAEMRNWVFVKIITDQDVYGWGEATVEWKTRAVVGAIEDLKPLIVGKDPRQIKQNYQIMTKHAFWKMGIIGMSAISGIEHAMWDILGKSLDTPVWQLLGGKVRDKVKIYTHLGMGDMKAVYRDTMNVTALADHAQKLVDLGYSAFKVVFIPFTHFTVTNQELKNVNLLMSSLRDKVGDDIEIMVDFHGRCGSGRSAIQYVKELEPYKPMFIEEPIQPGDTSTLLQIKESINCPLATGERLIGLQEFEPIFHLRAVDIAQPDLNHCGGLLEAKSIAAAASVANIAIAPHNPNGPIAGAAALHFASSTPNHIIQEVMDQSVPWYNDVISTSPIERKGNSWEIPSKAGLGIEVNEKEASKYPFKQEIIPTTDAYLEDGTVVDW